MEKEVKIKARDSKIIKGTLGVSKKKANKLVILVHGFKGHKDSHLTFNGAKFFTTKGLDTFRFNLYGSKKEKGRHFNDTKISIHGQDITDVVRYFRKKYKQIYLVGHSYGGTSLLFADQSLVDGFVFWDASYIDEADSKDGIEYNKNLDAYVVDFEVSDAIVGKPFIEELKNFPDCGELIKKIHKSVLFVTAGKGNPKAGKKYFALANQPKKLVTIKTADHNFNQWHNEEELFTETYKWLKTK